MNALEAAAEHAAKQAEAAPASHRYSISPVDADMLQGVATIGGEVRTYLLRQYVENHGVDALIGLFGEFVGLANTVAENAKESAIVVLINEGIHPYEAEKLNAPTVWGALEGVKLAAGVNPAPTCGGCAFRLGTVANTSPCTTLDAAACVQPGGQNFGCHVEFDAAGDPTHACAGWAQARKKASKNHD